jgi:nitrite reductase (NO-forming)
MKTASSHAQLTMPVKLRRALTAAALAATTLAFAQSTFACDACNVTFGNELMKERAGSLLAADLLAAARNQSGLKLEGLGSGAFKPPADPTVLAQAEPAEETRTDASPTLPTPAVAQPTSPVQRPAGAPYDIVPKEWEDDPFIDIIQRDYNLPVPPTSYVPQSTKPDKSFTIELSEGKTYIGNGVLYDGFLTNGTVPGPLLLVDEGDIVEMNVVNKGTIPHGASIHAAGTQTSKYLGKINPGSTGRVVFRATQPGVYLYHCAPGGHAIPMHVLFGQYGMIVVKPKREKYEMEKVLQKEPDLELYLVQHELYASGKDAVEGKPLYTTFNGKLFRYVEEPIKVRPGDYVRIYFLNVGPNLLSTFHIVGIVWDYVYWQGNPKVAWPGGQSVTAGPTDSFVIDFRIPPDEGAYTMLSHAVGSTSRGAIGLLVAEKDADTPKVVTPEGLKTEAAEMTELEQKATRTISPFKPTSYDQSARYAPGTKEVTVSITGNSFWPKIIEIEPGTTVKWVNEDVFTYLAGEFAGIHNAASIGAEDGFTTPLLAHGESATHVFEAEGEYEYMCTPHPYMRGKIIVKKPTIDLAALNSTSASTQGAMWLLPLAAGAFLVALVSLYRAGSKPAA